MKRKIWKLFAPIALMAVLIFSTIFATGCYVIHGVKMRDLVGTYELTRYSAKTDILTEREMKLYMVINSDGKGYYVYKDKDTAAYAAEMQLRFETNEEDSSKYEYVHVKFNQQSEEVKFGVNSKNLNYSKIVWKQLTLDNLKLEQDYTISVGFQKVSKETDLSFVNETLGVNLTALPYGLANLNGIYQCNMPMLNGRSIDKVELLEFNQEKPLYLYASLDVFNNKAKLYYAYPSANQPLTKEFDITIAKVDTLGNFTVTAGGYSVTLEGAASARRLIINQPVQDKNGSAQTLVWELYYYTELDYDLTETINTAIAAQTENERICELRSEHNFSAGCDQDKICRTCNLIEKATAHTYDDDNDAECNVCKQTREIAQQNPESSEGE